MKIRKLSILPLLLLLLWPQPASGQVQAAIGSYAGEVKVYGDLVASHALVVVTITGWESVQTSHAAGGPPSSDGGLPRGGTPAPAFGASNADAPTFSTTQVHKTSSMSTSGSISASGHPGVAVDFQQSQTLQQTINIPGSTQGTQITSQSLRLTYTP